MYKYTILKVNGSVEQFDSKKLSLESLQRHVGGFIELLARPADFGIKATGTVYINEDGKLLGLPANTLCQPSSYGDVIVGNVLIEEKIK